MHQQGDLHWHLCIDLVYCEVRDIDVKKQSETRTDVRDERDELQMLERGGGRERAWRQRVWLRRDASWRRWRRWRRTSKRLGYIGLWGGVWIYTR
jgi:hypothetical protein